MKVASLLLDSWAVFFFYNLLALKSGILYQRHLIVLPEYFHSPEGLCWIWGGWS